VWLSALLLVVVLVYIYPMRIMLEGFFSWLSNDYLPSSFEVRNYEELRFMFAFMGSAFAMLCLTFVLMYGYALRGAGMLLLNDRERLKTTTMLRVWAGSLVIGLVLILLAVLVPDRFVPFSGLVLFLLGAWVPYAESRYPRKLTLKQAG
jgi:hypothetical protein